MVAQITEGTAFDKHGRPFRRRNARPAIALLIVLLVASAVVWTIALTRLVFGPAMNIQSPPNLSAGLSLCGHDFVPRLTRWRNGVLAS